MTRRRFTGLGLVAVLAFGAATLNGISVSNASRNETFLLWMNRARGADLTIGWRLQNMADDHSLVMARAGHIFHTSNLGDKLTDANVQWNHKGENVGVVGVGDLWQLFMVFMDSPPHRRNILDPDFSRVGIGIVERDEFLWVTTIFVG